jgi:ribose transport system substrate-binding protein
LLRVLRAQGKEAPNLILFRYAVGSESTEQREQGFEDAINAAIDSQRRAGKPTITWLSKDKYAGATKDSALREAAPLLNNLKGKGIDGIFAVNESSANGMLDALRSLGLNRQVRLMGFDSSEPLLQAVRERDIDGLILQDPYKMGYLGVWVLVQHLQGRDVGKAADFMGTGEYLITRDEHDPARKTFRLDSDETRSLYDPAYQSRRTSRQLREGVPVRR